MARSASPVRPRRGSYRDPPPGAGRAAPPPRPPLTSSPPCRPAHSPSTTSPADRRGCPGRSGRGRPTRRRLRGRGQGPHVRRVRTGPDRRRRSALRVRGDSSVGFGRHVADPGLHQRRAGQRVRSGRRGARSPRRDRPHVRGVGRLRRRRRPRPRPRRHRADQPSGDPGRDRPAASRATPADPTAPSPPPC